MIVKDIDMDEIIFMDKDGAKRIEITNLDLLIMIWLDKFGYLNCDTFITDEIPYERIRRRLKKLYEYTYVDRYRFNIYYKYDYRLKSKAMRFLQEYYYTPEYNLDKSMERTAAKYNAQQSEHQNLCARIGWQLLMSGVDSREIVSDRDRKMFRYDMKKRNVFKGFYDSHRFLKDAVNGDIIIGRNNTTYVSVELEKTYKGKARTQEKLKKYRTGKCVAALWITEKSHKVLRQIIDEESRNPYGNTKHLIMDIDKIETAGDNIISMLDKKYARDEKEKELEKWNKYKTKESEIKECALDPESLKKIGIHQTPSMEEYIADDYAAIIVNNYIIPCVKRQEAEIERLKQKLEEIPSFALKSSDRQKYGVQRTKIEDIIKSREKDIDKIIHSETLERLPVELLMKILE